MTLVRVPNRPIVFTSFNNLLSDVISQIPSLYKEDLKQVAPVNIKETENAYEVQVIAPGLNKQDIKIKVEDKSLKVSYEQNEWYNGSHRI